MYESNDGYSRKDRSTEIAKGSEVIQDQGERDYEEQKGHVG